MSTKFNRRVLVTGAEGLLGSHLVALGGTPSQRISHYQSWVDELRHPYDAVIHCAAKTNVDWCELNSSESMRDNLYSVKWLVDYARYKNLSIPIVFISTDFIFDGQYGPYAEGDVLCPISVYGMQKALAESIIRQYENHLIVRTTCVYGLHPTKQTFLQWVLERLSSDDKQIPIATNMTTPTDVRELARLIVSHVEDGRQGIAHVAAEPMSRHDFACRIATAFGHDETRLVPVEPYRVGFTARRPIYGGLISQSPQHRPTIDCLADYAKEISPLPR